MDGRQKVEADAIEQIRNVTRLPILAGKVVVIPERPLAFDLNPSPEPRAPRRQPFSPPFVPRFWPLLPAPVSGNRLSCQSRHLADFAVLEGEMGVK